MNLRLPAFSLDFVKREVTRHGVTPAFVGFACVALLLAAAGAATDSDAKAELRRVTWNSRTRAYALFVPASHPPEPLPVIVLHHGTGGTGLQMVQAWRDLAQKEKLILVAPDGEGKFGWTVPDDGPELQQHILDALQSEYPIDPRRIYLFGFSAGGDFVFYAALQQSRYFAAACIHQASLRPRQFPMLDLAERKIPLFYSWGVEDHVYLIAEVRATRRAFEQRKWPLMLVENPGAHGYDAAATNSKCWSYLKKQSLPAPPVRTPLSDLWLSYALR